jgi:hypothetical protein
MKFTDRIEFASALMTRQCDKACLEEELKADIEAFLAKGGTIEQVPYDPVEEICARVGHWEPLGSIDDELSFDFEEPYG